MNSCGRAMEDFVEKVVMLIDYVVEYFRKSKLTLRLMERNFSWPMVKKQLSLREDPLWDKLMTELKKHLCKEAYGGRAV